MDIGTIHGIYTVVFMLAFLVMAVWVFLPRRKHRYDDVAALPMSDVAKPDAGESRERNQGE